MKKRILTLMMALAMVFTLCSCGDSTDAPSKPQQETPAASSQSKPESSTAQEEAPQDEVKQEAFEETVLVDNDGCRVVAKAIDPNGFMGYTVKLEVENKTDKTLMFSVDACTVDGYMAAPFWASEIAGGKKSMESVSWGSDALEACGIQDPSQIKFTLEAYDSEKFMETLEMDYAAQETCTIYPKGKDAVPEQWNDLPAGETLVEKDGITVRMVKRGVDDLWGYAVTLAIENDTDQHLMFSVDDCAVNGYMCDPLWATDVLPNCKAVTDVTWLSTMLEDQGVTPEDVQEIEMTLSASDFEDLFGDDIVNEKVTLK